MILSVALLIHNLFFEDLYPTINFIKLHKMSQNCWINATVHNNPRVDLTNTKLNFQSGWHHVHLPTLIWARIINICWIFKSIFNFSNIDHLRAFPWSKKKKFLKTLPELFNSKNKSIHGMEIVLRWNLWQLCGCFPKYIVTSP